MWKTLTRKMKDSGVEWIGEIPEDWEVRKLGNLSNLYTGNSIKDNEKDNYTDNLNSIPYIATKDVNNNHTINYKNGMYVKEDDLSFKIALKDSTLICIEGGSAGTKIAYLDQDVTFGNKLCAVYSEFVSNKYLYYYILSPCFNNSFNSRITGLIPGVTLSEMSKIEVVIPPATKQYKIVKALDEKVTKIAALQSETQQSIKELKKYKQSLITEAVTKGLDPNVEMKDSGINWVERIPAHWNVSKGKYLFNKMDRPIEIEETVTAFRDGQVVQRKKRRTDGFTNSLKEIGYQGVKQGDLVIHSMDAFAGAIGISEDDGKCSPVCIVLDSENPNIYNPYFSYLMRVYSILGYIESMSKGIRVRSTDFKHNTFANTSLLFPSFVEQKEIVNYIEEETSLIDKLITDKTKVIEELEDYKKSLIYEYVTGKKEV